MGFESLRGSQHLPTLPAEFPPSPAELLPWRRLLRRLVLQPEPVADLICGPDVAQAPRLVAVPGSFNPPHVAHLALMQAALAASGARHGVFVLSAVTVDKERVTGLLLEDRLWLLCRLAADPSWFPAGSGVGVVVTNRGLYVDLAEALHRLAPQVERIEFVTGYDKIVQIFDARYYEQRQATLDRLFDQACFRVAPRDAATVADLEALLALPQNARYAASVRPLDLDPALAGVSSSRARAGLRAAGAPPGADLPPLVQRFLAATGAYAAPEGAGDYGRREDAVAALEPGPGDDSSPG